METTVTAPKETPNSLDHKPVLSTITIEEPMNDGKDEDGNDKENPAIPTTTKEKTTEIDLPITSRVSGITREDLDGFIKQENEMIEQDKREQERLDAKNAYEEHIYEIRNKLNDGEFGNYADDNMRQELLKDLQTTLDWLAHEGAHQETSVYIERLKSLKANK